MQRLGDQAEVELLEVAQPAVEHLGAAGGGARREVAGLDEAGTQAARDGVQRDARARDTTADDEDVEFALDSDAFVCVPVTDYEVAQSTLARMTARLSASSAAPLDGLVRDPDLLRQALDQVRAVMP